MKKLFGANYEDYYIEETKIHRFNNQSDSIFRIKYKAYFFGVEFYRYYTELLGEGISIVKSDNKKDIERCYKFNKLFEKELIKHKD